MTDPIERALMEELAKAIEVETGEGVIYALFIDWRDGRPITYLSNGARTDVVKALKEWQGKASRGDPTLRETLSESVPPLEAKCVEICRAMKEEGIDVVLFLFTVGDGGTTSWVSTMKNGLKLIEAFIKSEDQRAST